MTSAIARAPAAILPRWVRAALVVIGLSPWCVPFVRRASEPVGAALDLLFWPVCHRLPERTLVLASVPMPLCSRCAGVFLGFAVGAIVARPRVSPTTWRLLLTLAMLLMLLDVATQDLGLHPVWHATRLATGGLFGYAVGAAIIVWLRALFAPA